MVGVIGVLYGALGATQAAQTAFNQVYGVPRFRQPDPIRSRLRGLGLLLLLGTAVAVSTGITAVVSTANGLSSQLGTGAMVGSYAVTFLINCALFSFAYRLLTALDLRLRDVLTGGILAGAAWELLQTLGARYIAHELSRSTALYGAFGVVVATLAWIYLEALALTLAAEVNVVRSLHLYPRALAGQWVGYFEPTPADEAAYRLYVSSQQFKPIEEIVVRFDRGAAGRRAARRRHAAGTDGGAPVGDDPNGGCADAPDARRPTDSVPEGTPAGASDEGTAAAPSHAGQSVAPREAAEQGP
ncbi:MAG: YihY/virulence factor BrkB family protein [Acidimicrobiales bacterium]